jgi:hypothetical protein
LQAVEVGAADTQALGTELRYRAVDFLHRFGRVGEVGMAPEVEVRRVFGTVDRDLVVADACVLVAEITGPVHEGMRWRGQHQLVDPTLGHQAAARRVRHAREHVGLGFGVARRRLAVLVGAQREVPDRQALRLHERAPEVVPIQHAGGEQMSVDIDQQRGLPVDAVRLKQCNS